MTIRELVVARLAKAGLTQAELSRVTGIQRSNLSAMLAGKRPMTPLHLFLISNMLDLGELDCGGCVLPERE